MIPEATSRYRILGQIGGGGMGVVYSAEDTQLRRTVALKFLPPTYTTDPDARERLVHEARAASALQHRNICTIHEIGETPDGQMFICMDFYEGATLKKRTAEGPLPVREALDIAIQTARGLAEAHQHGIVHRDIKPTNLLLTRSGEVKIVDFGLAKQPDQTQLTQTGSTVGTPAYMSPEHVQGDEVDARADVWSVGVTLYEMLTGTQPFKGGTPSALLMAIVNEEPKPVDVVRPEVPAALAAAVRKALAKKPEARYANAGELLHDLLKVEQALSAPAARPSRFAPVARTLRKPVVWVPLSVVLLAGAIAGGFFVNRWMNVRWARQEAMPKIRELATAGQNASDFSKFGEAFALAKQAERYIGADAGFQALWPRFSGLMTITSDPPGARVSRMPYASAKDEWQEVGLTPLKTMRIPYGYHRWKFEKEGYETVLAIGYARATLHRVLDRTGTVPEGMVRVVVYENTLPDKWKKALATLPAEKAGGPRSLDFFIDRYEVTNAHYKRFVEAGGYQNASYWKHEFVKDGKKLSWEQAMREFVDATGLPGPSTWEAGSYTAGQDEYPVSGVSWYEAAAYAESVGKELPTDGHWLLASALAESYNFYEFMSKLADWANFKGSGPARVGSSAALDLFGEYDMAGNVREWCWNETPNGRRVRGGAWSDFTYMYGNDSQAPPSDRSPKNGFRCARYIDRSAIPAPAFAQAVDLPTRDYTKEKPVGDAVFKVYRDQFTYTPTDLQAKLETKDDKAPDWAVEKVSFSAAYPKDRVTAYLFLPKNAAAPFQTVIYFPGNPASIYSSKSEALIGMSYVASVIRSGRALVYPVYYGTYERNTTGVNGEMSVPTPEYRDAYTELLVKWGRDFKRTIDYLESRKDIDSTRLAFFGWSWGGQVGPVMTAIDDRLKASVLYLGGLMPGAARPEADSFNYIPHVRVPTLMLNGRYDLTFPLQTQVQPMFDRLGAEHKELKLYDSDHYIPRQDLSKETLAWFDKYLGPVSLQPAK